MDQPLVLDIISAKMLDNPKNVQSLSLRGCLPALNELQFDRICDQLAACTNLRVLDLSWNNQTILDGLMIEYIPLSSQQWEKLCTVIASLNKLEDLNFTSFKIFYSSVAHWRCFCTLIPQIARLKRLSLSKNCLSHLNDDMWELFCDNLSLCNKLEYLDLSENSLVNLSLDTWHNFCNAFSENNKIKHINISQNGLNSLDIHECRAMCTLISKWSNLEIFDFSDNEQLYNVFVDEDEPLEVVSEQIIIFCHALTMHGKVKSLQVAGNNFGEAVPELWAIFCDALPKFTNLEILDLANNELAKLANECWEYFCAALAKSQSIVSIDFSDNQLEELSYYKWIRLVEALLFMPNLNFVYGIEDMPAELLEKLYTAKGHFILNSQKGGVAAEYALANRKLLYAYTREQVRTLSCNMNEDVTRHIMSFLPKPSTNFTGLMLTSQQSNLTSARIRETMR